MISSRSSEGFRPLTPTDVNKCTTAGTSKNGNSVTILQTDSPRTCDLKNLRAKRLAYFVDRNHCYTNSTLAIGSLGDRQVNNNYTNGDPPRENVLNVEQNISLKEKNLDVNEPVQHTQVKNIQGMHCTDLETTLKISESAEEATCLPKPDYNFLENPTISEIEKLRHILCWAQKILKKSKEVSNTQVCQNTTVNETKLAEEHMNPDISQTTTFNRPSSTNKSTCSSPVGSRYDYTNYSADSSSGSCSSLDLLRSNRTLFQTSSPLNDVQEQYTSTNTGYSSKHHFDSNNILQRESTGQVDTYKVSGNNWTCESKILETKLPSENSDSLIDKVNALKKNDYFWIPLEGGSDDENIIENRQMKEASVDHFVKDIIPHFCDSTNQYHNNGEPILSARTVVIRTSPTTCHSSGGVLGNSVNLHNTTQHNVRSDYHYNNNNANPALSSRTVTLRRSPATNCNSLGNVLGNPVNLHYAVPHCKSTVCNQGKHNYAWEDKKVEEYSGCYEISQGDPKIAYMLRDSLSLEKDGFNLKSPFALSVIPIPCKGITESSDETTANKKGKRTNLVKGSQEIPNSDQTLKKNRNLCNANENFVSCSSISPKDCSDIILDSRGSENLPALDNYVVKKQTNCNNDEKEAKYQITESKAQHTLKLSSLPLQSSYDFNNSKISSLQFKKEESIERERDHITKEYRGSFLYTSNLVKRCPKCKSDNNSTVNWCTKCGCVLIGIVPQHCDVTSNVDRCAFSNPRGSSNKEKIDILPTIATDGLKEDFEIAESNNYDFKDSEDSACFPSEMKELQLSAYQKYLLYMGHLEKIRGQHQTPEHLQTDALLEKESTNQTKSKDENQNFCGECEPEDSNIASFKLSTHFTNQTDKKHIDYEQDSEDNPILIPEMGKIPLAENVQEALELHCGIQKRNYLKQNSNVEKSKNIFHGTTLKQNFGNQNFISLKHENNKETLKVAEKKPRRKNDIQSSINQHQRCWEKSSIAGLSYTRGGIKTRSTNANHPRSDDECHGTKGKPLLLYGCSAVHMKNNKVPWKQPIKRLVNGNILDARRSKLPFENTAVTLRPTMKPRETAKYFRNNASQFCAKQICQGDDNHSPWLFLPDEIWIRVFTLLPHHDLCQVAQVCYCFYRLANDEML
ncbi:uncharacterized protein [Narcine bancroftii]|uniref:uncharacterized protein n=1 Tax=Narcine bancroftii TaxID=1343680 RepID=UPI003832185F